MDMEVGLLRGQDKTIPLIGPSHLFFLRGRWNLFEFTHLFRKDYMLECIRSWSGEGNERALRCWAERVVFYSVQPFLAPMLWHTSSACDTVRVVGVWHQNNVLYHILNIARTDTFQYIHSQGMLLKRITNGLKAFQDRCEKKNDNFSFKTCYQQCTSQKALVFYLWPKKIICPFNKKLTMLPTGAFWTAPSNWQPEL